MCKILPFLVCPFTSLLVEKIATRCSLCNKLWLQSCWQSFGPSQKRSTIYPILAHAIHPLQLQIILKKSMWREIYVHVEKMDYLVYKLVETVERILVTLMSWTLAVWVMIPMRETRNMTSRRTSLIYLIKCYSKDTFTFIVWYMIFDILNNFSSLETNLWLFPITLKML